MNTWLKRVGDSYTLSPKPVDGFIPLRKCNIDVWGQGGNLYQDITCEDEHGNVIVVACGVRPRNITYLGE